MGIALPHSWTIGLQKIIVRINHNTLSTGAILHCKIILKIQLVENKEVTLLVELNW